MKRFSLAVLAALVTVLAPSFPHAGARLLTATVQRVADGDTVIAETANGAKLRLRLLGIDAPEVSHNGKSGQPFGEEARRYLEELVKGREVKVEAHGPDRYKRALAMLWRDGVNVNVTMVRAGLAERYRGARCQAYCRELEQAEREARQGRVGVWSQARPESPRDFRRRMPLSGE